MDNSYIPYILIALVIAAVVIYLLTRSRTGTPPDAIDLPPAELSTSAAEGLIDPVSAIPPEAVGAPADLAGDALAPPEEDLREAPVPAGPPDELTRIKGLGPKAAARLNELGITRYDQLAALAGARLDGVDAQMGAFKGRIVRDRWVEQAGHLAAGDTAGFEAKFGKLGG